MKMQDLYRRFVCLYRCIEQGWSCGGITHVNHSEINLGVFSRNDVILVSGGSKGIGLSITNKLLKEGATVIATGRDYSKLLKLSKK